MLIPCILIIDSRGGSFATRMIRAKIIRGAPPTKCLVCYGKHAE